MKASLALLLFAVSVSAAAQSADAIYKQACGPKGEVFDAQLIKGRALPVTEAGKALVVFIQKQSGRRFTTRIGIDGVWVGAAQNDSYVFASVVPGEHHACAAGQDRKNPKPELLHFTAEAGKVYYFLVRGIGVQAEGGDLATLVLGVPDLDEALFLIASDPHSVASSRR